MRFICLIVVILSAASLPAQEMHHAQGPAVRSTTLTVTGLNGQDVVLTANDFKALPHHSITVANGHTHSNETYSGVPLIALLAKVGAPQGADLKGAVFMTGVIAEGTDHYKVLYSLAEIDPSFHAGDVLVADSLDGKDLGEAGMFKLVSSEDKRPARWVRNLKAISAVVVKP